MTDYNEHLIHDDEPESDRFCLNYVFLVFISTCLLIYGGIIIVKLITG